MPSEPRARPADAEHDVQIAQVPAGEREPMAEPDVARREPARTRADPAVFKTVTLAGRVVDRAGRPVIGAELFHGVTARASHGIRIATTDERGEFRITGFSGVSFSFRIASDDHPDLLAQGSTKEAVADGLEFVLADSAEIRGRVVGAPDDLLEGLWVRADRAEGAERSDRNRGVGPADARPAPRLPRWTRCAADGSFVVRGLEPAALLRLGAYDEEGVSYERPITTVIEVRAGSTEVELTYRSPTGIACQVVDARTLEPVTAFEARIGQRQLARVLGPDGGAKHDFPDGRLRWPYVLPADPQELSIAAHGYAELRIEVHPLEGRMLDLGILRLESVPMAEVLVLDLATREPVEGALVTLFDPRAPRTDSPWYEQRTDTEGRARLNVLSGAVAVLRVRHENYETLQSELSLDSGDRYETVHLRRKAL
jgi:hypothetical protein